MHEVDAPTAGTPLPGSNRYRATYPNRDGKV